MGESKRKKPRKYRAKRRAHRPSGHGGPSGGSPRRTLPPPNMLRRAYNYKAEPKPAPTEKKSNWNGKVEVWTEPQKPRQEKVIKYEVNTDELINELAIENKKTISEIAEKLNANAEPSSEQSDENDLQKLDSTESEAEPIDEAEIPDQEELETDGAEPIEQEVSFELEQTNEIESIEQQIDPQELQIEAEDAMDDPTFADPAFWEQLESGLSEELEQLEQEEDLEPPTEGGAY